MLHISNCVFLLLSFSKETLPLHHIYFTLVEEDYVSIIYDDSNVSVSDLEFEDLI